MSVSGVRTEIKGILQGVPNVGQVQDYDRWTTDWTTYLSLFQATVGGVTQIRGWAMHAQSGQDRYLDTNTVAEREHLFILRGYLSLKDSDGTEKVFDDLVEAVQAAFLGKPTLNGSALLADPPQVIVKEARFLGDVFVHYAELHLRVRERSTY